MYCATRNIRRDFSNSLKPHILLLRNGIQQLFFQKVDVSGPLLERDPRWFDSRKRPLKSIRSLALVSYSDAWTSDDVISKMAAVLDSAEDYKDFVKKRFSVNCRRLFVDLQGDHAKHTILIETHWIIESVCISLGEIAMMLYCLLAWFP